MKILIISGKEYSISNRGIDVITTFLERTHIVDHLFFYVRGYKPDTSISKNLTQKYFVDYANIYRDKFKYFVPSFVLNYIFKQMVQKSKFDFSRYDYIILESGYPILLAKYIKQPIIYRQSDPIEIAFNTRRKYFYNVEKYLYKKAVSISSALNPIFYPKEFKEKFVFWKTGFLSVDYKYVEKKNQIIYMGGVPVDYKLLKKVAKKYPNYKFIVIGNHKDKIKLLNVQFTGYLGFDRYKELIIHSKIFFSPIPKYYLKCLKKAELTSKFYLPISFGIPLITRAYGTVKGIDYRKKVFTYKTDSEALRIFDSMLLNGNFMDFVVSESAKDFLYKQTIHYKENELYEYFEKIFGC